MSSTKNQQVRLTAKDLKISYGTQIALKCESLQVQGSVIALVGHNGAGKSTFIKALLDLLPRDSGTSETSLCTNDGSDTALVPCEHMAFCPETGSVFADISVESYIKLWCRIKHGDPKYFMKAGATYIEQLHLGPLLPKLGRELSKGERRRVQTAIGFLTNPKLFLFDEPFDGLDIQKSHELSDLFASQALKTCFIISSHRMDVVERLADIVIVLKEGQVVSAGPIEQVCKDLCEQSVQISNVCDYDLLLSELKRSFPKTVINRIGDNISITGPEFNLQTLSDVIRATDRNGATLLPIKPSLVDAMNYHLRNAQSK